MTTVVIVTYNSAEYIEDCLRSVFEQMEGLFVLVIDNASEDKTVELVKWNFPDVEVVCSPSNVGFAKASNNGITIALRNGADEVLLLNPDTFMEKRALRMMQKTLWSDKNRGVVQPLLTLMKEPNRVNTWGNAYRGFGIVSVGGYNREIHHPQLRIHNSRIEYASGACMLVKAEVFEKVGLLDERFFLYFEDTEFSDRVRNRGYEIWLAADARVQHDYEMPLTLRKFGNWVMGWMKYLSLKGL